MKPPLPLLSITAILSPSVPLKADDITELQKITLGDKEIVYKYRMPAQEDGIAGSDLKSMLEKAGNDNNKLNKLQEKIASLKFLDPACGCGNFLVIAYRELRLLELEIL